MKALWLLMGVTAFGGLLLIAGLFVTAEKPAFISATGLPVPVQGSTDASAYTEARLTPAYRTGLEQLPASVSDIDIPGNLQVDEQGNLVIDLSLRHLFDFFLTANGEESPENIVARLRAYLNAMLAPQAAQQAIATLESYLAYLDALENLQDPGGKPVETLDLNAIDARKQQEQALRNQFLDPDIQQTFFGRDDAFDNYALALTRLNSDPQLSAADKSRSHHLLMEQLPQDLRYQVEESQRLYELHQAEQQLRETGVADMAEQLFALRTRLLDQEKATALEQVDNHQQQWQGRIARYLHQRQSYIDNPGIADPERTQLINHLRQEQFNRNELKRVEAYEHIHDRGELTALQ